MEAAFETVFSQGEEVILFAVRARGAGQGGGGVQYYYLLFFCKAGGGKYCLSARWAEEEGGKTIMIDVFFRGGESIILFA